jgi:hypothetical protein
MNYCNLDLTNVLGHQFPFSVTAADNRTFSIPKISGRRKTDPYRDESDVKSRSRWERGRVFGIHQRVFYNFNSTYPREHSLQLIYLICQYIFVKLGT